MEVLPSFTIGFMSNPSWWPSSNDSVRNSSTSQVVLWYPSLSLKLDSWVLPSVDSWIVGYSSSINSVVLGTSSNIVESSINPFSRTPPIDNS